MGVYQPLPQLNWRRNILLYFLRQKNWILETLKIQLHVNKLNVSQSQMSVCLKLLLIQYKRVVISKSDFSERYLESFFVCVLFLCVCCFVCLFVLVFVCLFCVCFEVVLFCCFFCNDVFVVASLHLAWCNLR